MAAPSPPRTAPTPTMAPHATIVGAGIAGLSAAVALRRAGWRVDVYERSRFKNEIGAAITVPPNAALVLARWGYDFDASPEPVPNESTRLAAAADLRELARLEYPRAGAWSFHRVDLHRALRDMAAAEAARIRLGEEVKGVDCEAGRVRLQGGAEVESDLVVIADGAHSRLLPDLVGGPAPPPPTHHTGRSVYRWLVPMEAVRADAELRAQFEGQPPGFLAWHDAGRRVLWVSYACRGGAVLNNAVVCDTEADNDDNDEGELWNTPASKTQVLRTVARFHPTARKLVHLADDDDGIKVHRLFKRSPLGSFVRGRAVVLGDAAHVMLPTHAAAGGLAIESAAALEVLLRGVQGGGDAQVVSERLRLFDALRVPRCNLTLLASNAGAEWLRVPGVEDEIRRYYAGPLPPEDAMPWSDEFREVLFHHDVFAAAEEALRKGSRDWA
ncbi:hypothetical protein F4775DRAFT_598263 [Biscogniauxia sp. FL1348]|nr:hypothetical protein F4775DRAFT_598263 [Biscogniauxia sp. FL1348]